MAVDFSDVIGPHSDDAKEADKIIDTVSSSPSCQRGPGGCPWCCRCSRLAVEWLHRAKDNRRCERVACAIMRFSLLNVRSAC